MPKLTKERLAEIEARVATTHAYFSTKSACDDLRDLIAAVRELQGRIVTLETDRSHWMSQANEYREALASLEEDPNGALRAENERLRQGAAEAYQMAGNSDYPVGYMDNFLALAEGDPLPHEWKALIRQDHEARAVRAKIEAARDGGER